jgi:anti-anti-sigma factor
MNHTDCKLSTKVSGKYGVISVEGSIDQSAPSSGRVIEELVGGNIEVGVLDLSGADLIDSDGLDWLEEIRSGLEDRGIGLRIVAASEGKVGRILRLMQYDQLAELFDSLSGAVPVAQSSMEVSNQ